MAEHTPVALTDAPTASMKMEYREQAQNRIKNVFALRRMLLAEFEALVEPPPGAQNTLIWFSSAKNKDGTDFYAQGEIEAVQEDAMDDFFRTLHHGFDQIKKRQEVSVLQSHSRAKSKGLM